MEIYFMYSAYRFHKSDSVVDDTGGMLNGSQPIRIEIQKELLYKCEYNLTNKTMSSEFASYFVTYLKHKLKGISS